MKNNNSKRAQKRISNRVYGLIKCRKPDCEILFNPTDSRQIFCCSQHRIDFNNDSRKQKNEYPNKLKKILIANDEVLKRIDNRLGTGSQKFVHKDILILSGYIFGGEGGFIAVNEETGKRVLWNIYYGIEGYSTDQKTFIIRHRNTIQ